jgi:hypothetical protein
MPGYILSRKNCFIIRIGCTVIAWAENVWVISRVRTSRLLNPLHIPRTVRGTPWNTTQCLTSKQTTHCFACMITLLLTASFLFRFITFTNFQYKCK